MPMPTFPDAEILNSDEVAHVVPVVVATSKSGVWEPFVFWILRRAYGEVVPMEILPFKYALPWSSSWASEVVPVAPMSTVLVEVATRIPEPL